MPLKLSLKPGEKFVLNGAVVQNGDRRSALLLQNKASVLREKDIMQADEATTPSRRIYFPVMMMYLDQADVRRVTRTNSSDDCRNSWGRCAIRTYLRTASIFRGT